jgi:ribose 5-phosphate isomerase B
MKVRTIAIGCDHAGFPYKSAIIQTLSDAGISIIDKGTYSLDSVDYPDFVHPVAEALEEGHAELGVLMCGSGNGVCMTANKHQSIRAGLCWSEEIAQLARSHNDANILCIPVRFVSENIAVGLVKTFINTEFEGGRHARRVGKIAC